jgi:transcriptional regulator with XRE-family HTH domain
MDHAAYKKIPNALRRYREEAGLSQQKVAHLLNLKNNTLISRWERGEALPCLVNACKLSKFYGTSLDMLFSGLLEKEEE